jgi:AcrR family transcriptional regulator
MARIRRAATELVVERGFDETTVEAVVARAAVGRDQFVERFVDLRDCCMQIYIANIEEFDRIVFGMVERADGWRDRLRASAYAAVRYIQRRPIEARFNLIQMLTVGEGAQLTRDRYVERIIDLIDSGREELDNPSAVPRDIATGAFGSVYEFLVKQFHDGADVSRLEQYVPDLMYIAVSPYVGHDRAREELAIAAPPKGENYE